MPKERFVFPDDHPLQFRPPAKPRKQPRQQRSIALVDALKESCRDILEREGGAGLSLNRISEHAGVSVSSIYEYFPTMESLIAAVFFDFRHEMRARIAKQVATLPPGTSLASALDLVLDEGIADLLRWSQMDPAFFTKSSQYEELLRLDMIRSESDPPSIVSEALVARFASDIIIDPDKAVFFVHQTLLSLPRAAALTRPDYLADEETPRLIKRMLHALLTGSVDAA